MSCARPAQGFTLLEVLVALAVAALLFLALGSVTQRQLAVGAGLEKRAAAEQLGSNLIELYQLGEGDAGGPFVDGRGQMGNYTFAWTRRVVVLEGVGVRRLELQVTEGGDIFYEQRLYLAAE